MSFLFWSKTEEDKKIEERENEDKLENKLEDKKKTEKQEDLKVEIPLQEENHQLFKFQKKEQVNNLIKEPLKEKERITYVIKRAFTDNKEVNKATAQKDKDNNNQVISEKKEKKLRKKLKVRNTSF